MRYRLGLDIGTNSIGWATVKLDEKNEPFELYDVGVRIFLDGRAFKSKASLAVDRREARSARRRGDRYHKRRSRLLRLLVDYGLMPPQSATLSWKDMSVYLARETGLMDNATKDENPEILLDPYRLRVLALDEPLHPYLLGRALFHLNQRRGFKSNRKIEQEDESEKGVIKAGIEKLKAQLSDERTLGEFLWKRKEEGKHTRFTGEVTTGKEGEEGIYPSREMLESELAKIRKSQEPHQNLDSHQWDEICDTILFQRPLRPVDPGWCTLDPKEKRAPLALPSAQRFRILQELGNLEISLSGQPERRLTKDERDMLLRALLNPENTDKQGMLSFHRMRGSKFLKLGQKSDSEFNLEDSKRKGLKGDETARRLAEGDIFGRRWLDMPLEKQDEIVEALLADSSGSGKNAFKKWKEELEAEMEMEKRAQTEWGLSEEQAQRLVRTTLPIGYSNLGRTALKRIVKDMETDHCGYAAARDKYPEYKQQDTTGVSSDSLPYYGEVLQRYMSGADEHAVDQVKKFGKIANPTVHIGLTQLRLVVNALIKLHGKPEQVSIEVARDLKNSKETRDKLQKEQSGNQKKNAARSEIIKQCGLIPSSELLRKLRLWEEQGPPQGRRCPFCGKIISAHEALTDATEMEHLIPYSVSLDDSMANQVLACRGCNREKGQRTPYEAFGAHADPKYNHRKMLSRIGVKIFPKNKRWRFEKNAMERFQDEEKFLDRQLNDTAYLSRVAKEYMTTIVPQNHIWVIPGRLTSQMRGIWGLNGLIPGGDTKSVWISENDPDLTEDIQAGRFKKGNRVMGSQLQKGLAKKLHVADYDNLKFIWEEQGIKFIVPVKTRSSHRHHAIDAFVISLISRSLIKQIADRARSADPATARRRLVEKWPSPWEIFSRHELRDKLERMVISHRTDRPAAGKNSYRKDIHGDKGKDATSGKLHEETAYSITGDEKGGNVAYRKSVDALEEKDIGKIRDEALREALEKSWRDFSSDNGKWKEFIKERIKTPAALEKVGYFGAQKGLRKVRITAVCNTLVKIENRHGVPYKAYKPGKNAFMDIYRMPDGKWKAATVTKFDANRKDFAERYQKLRPHPAAKKVMRLYKHDCIALEQNGERRIYRIQKMSGQDLYMAELHEANVDARTSAKDEPFKMMKKSVNPLRKDGMRKVNIDALGNIHDPGPHK